MSSVNFGKLKAVYEANKVSQSLLSNTPSSIKKRKYSEVKIQIDSKEENNFSLIASIDHLPIESRIKLLQEMNPNEENDKIIGELMFLLEEKDNKIASLEEELRNAIISKADSSKIGEENEVNKIIQNMNSQIKALYDKNNASVNELDNMRLKYESMIMMKNKEKEELEAQVASLSSKLQSIAEAYEKLYNDSNALKENTETAFNSLILQKRKSEILNEDLMRQNEQLRKSVNLSKERKGGESDSDDDNKKEIKKKIEFTIENLNQIEVEGISQSQENDNLKQKEINKEYEIENTELFDLINKKIKKELIIGDMKMVELFGKLKKKINNSVSEIKVVELLGKLKKKKENFVSEIKVIELLGKAKKKSILSLCNTNTLELFPKKQKKTLHLSLESKINNIELKNTSNIKKTIPFSIKQDNFNLISKKEEITKKNEKTTEKIKVFVYSMPYYFELISKAKKEEIPKNTIKSAEITNTIKTNDNSSFIDRLYSQNIYYKYLIDHSLSLNQILSLVSSYFSFISNNIVFRTLKKSFPLSLMNEILKNFVFLSHNFKDLTKKNLANFFYENNMINFYIKQKHNNDYEKDLLYENNKECINNMISEYEETTKMKIETLLEQCSSFFVNNTFQINNVELFKFVVNENDDNNLFTFNYSKKRNCLVLQVNLSCIHYDSIELLISKLVNNPKYYGINKIIFINSIKAHSTEHSFNIYSTLLSLLILPTITHISFKNSSIEPNIQNFIIQSVSYLDQITSLSIKNMGLRDENVNAILSSLVKTKKHLKHLNLSKNNIIFEEGDILKVFLTKSTSLSYINLSHNQIKAKGLKSILNTQTENNLHYSSLNLSNNNFSNEEFYVLSLYFQNNPNTEYFNISGNTIEMDGAIWLGDGLYKSPRIKKLNMSDAKLSGEMITAIFKGEDYLLEQVVLDNNELGEIGDVSLSKLLKTNKTIKLLSLKNTKMTAFGLTHILRGIETNKNFCLRNLYLSGNNLNESAVSKIFELGEKNKNLVLYISGSDVNSNQLKKKAELVNNVVLI